MQSPPTWTRFNLVREGGLCNTSHNFNRWRFYKMNNKFSRIQLHPELQPYLDRNEQTIEHPIYSCECAHPSIYHRINLIYESKKQKNDRPSSLPNEWESYLPHLSPRDRLLEVFKNEYMRTDPTYFKIVGQIWTDRELVGQTSSTLEVLLGIERFSGNRARSPNIIHMMTEVERQKLADLPDEFRIYRGHDERLLNEISWTLNLNVAGQYAVGWEEEHKISTGTVRKQDVIAFVDRWQESEIIVPPRVVRNIEIQPAIRIDK
jgi:hypothetical protein